MSRLKRLLTRGLPAPVPAKLDKTKQGRQSNSGKDERVGSQAPPSAPVHGKYGPNSTPRKATFREDMIGFMAGIFVGSMASLLCFASSIKPNQMTEQENEILELRHQVLQAKGAELQARAELDAFRRFKISTSSPGERITPPAIPIPAEIEEWP